MANSFALNVCVYLYRQYQYQYQIIYQWTATGDRDWQPVAYPHRSLQSSLTSRCCLLQSLLPDVIIYQLPSLLRATPVAGRRHRPLAAVAGRRYLPVATITDRCLSAQIYDHCLSRVT